MAYKTPAARMGRHRRPPTDDAGVSVTATPDQTFTRAEQHIESNGIRCAARVYRPRTETPGSSLPVIVMAHGFGGVRALRLYAYAERFAAAGYAAVGAGHQGAARPVFPGPTCPRGDLPRPRSDRSARRHHAAPHRTTSGPQDEQSRPTGAPRRECWRSAKQMTCPACT